MENNILVVLLNNYSYFRIWTRFLEHEMINKSFVSWIWFSPPRRPLWNCNYNNCSATNASNVILNTRGTTYHTFILPVGFAGKKKAASVQHGWREDNSKTIVVHRAVYSCHTTALSRKSFWSDRIDTSGVSYSRCLRRFPLIFVVSSIHFRHFWNIIRRLRPKLSRTIFWNAWFAFLILWVDVKVKFAAAYCMPKYFPFFLARRWWCKIVVTFS